MEHMRKVSAEPETGEFWHVYQKRFIVGWPGDTKTNRSNTEKWQVLGEGELAE